MYTKQQVHHILCNKAGGKHDARGKHAKRARQKQEIRKQLSDY
jgi:hypothetical protein